MSTQNWLRIKEFADSFGLSTSTIRAWEARYGLFRPHRSQGRYRVYDENDAIRLTAMLSEIDSGLAPSAAARVALRAHPLESAAGDADEPITLGNRYERAAQRLVDHLLMLDRQSTGRLLDSVLYSDRTTKVVERVLLPAVQRLGGMWLQGEILGVEGYQAFGLLRDDLAGRIPVAEPVGTVWLACPPGESHDLILHLAALLLREQGWGTVIFDTNADFMELAELAASHQPDFALIAIQRSIVLRREQRQVAALARRVPVVLAGPGARAETATAMGAACLSDDLVPAVRLLHEAWFTGGNGTTSTAPTSAEPAGFVARVSLRSRAHLSHAH